MTSNHSLPPHLPLDIRRLTRSFKISAPAPGKESKPASFNAFRTSICDMFSNLATCAISGGPKECNFNVGYSSFNCLNRSA
ncbi:hypothetical protein D3C72_1726930 [compost metagenome]